MLYCESISPEVTLQLGSLTGLIGVSVCLPAIVAQAKGQFLYVWWREQDSEMTQKS